MRFSSKNTFKRQPVSFNSYLVEAEAALTISSVKNIRHDRKGIILRGRKTQLCAPLNTKWGILNGKWQIIYWCGVWECNQGAQKKPSPLRTTFSNAVCSRGKLSFSCSRLGPMKSGYLGVPRGQALGSTRWGELWTGQKHMFPMFSSLPY